MKINIDHFKAFKNINQIKLDDEQWAGFKPKNWADYVSPRTLNPFSTDRLPNVQLNRAELKKICSVDSGYTDIECAACVMAWGGQNRKHAITLFNRFDDISEIVSDLRKGQMNRLEAYKRFYDIWVVPEPLGMGAAYFTKLIFFCGRDHDGYIMDQWTSKSANLLSKTPIVNLSSGHVNKKNNQQAYAEFFYFVEEIGSKLDACAENIELAMFSKGGRQKAPWRQYVIDHIGK